MVLETMEEGEPKTRGYSLRTRSSVTASKENIQTPKPDIKTKKKAATGAVAQRALKNKNIYVSNTSTRKTRAQLKYDSDKEEKEYKEGQAKAKTKPVTIGSAMNKQSDITVKEAVESKEENIEPKATEGQSNELLTEDCQGFTSPSAKKEERELEKTLKAKDKQIKDVQFEDDTVATEGSSLPVPNQSVSESISSPEKCETPAECGPGAAGAAPAAPEAQTEKDEPGPPARSSDAKTSFWNLPPEEQILIVRRKLERIIHKKETNQTKAVDLLKIIERMEMTEVLMDSTKIDLTLEALKFILKDKEVVDRTDQLLLKLKKLKKQEKKTVNDMKWRQPSTNTEKADKVTVSSTSNLLQWMDKFIESDKDKTKSKLESIDKKLDSLKTGVKTLNPVTTGDDKNNCNNKETKQNSQNYDFVESNKDESYIQENTKVLEDCSKIETLLKSVNELSEDDEKVLFYLKDISYQQQQLNKDIWKKTVLRETLKKLKGSSNKQIRKLARKMLKRFSYEKEPGSDLNDIEKKMKEINIKPKKENVSGKSDVQEKVQDKVQDEVQDLIKRVESVSLKQNKQYDTSSKLFTPLIPDSSSTFGNSHPKSDDFRLKRLELENNIHRMKVKLDDYKPGKKYAEDELLRMLHDLNKAPVTLELLESTKIGMTVNNFRKIVDDKVLASFGRDIIRKWKKLIPASEHSNGKLVPVKDDPPPEPEPSIEDKEKQEKENSEKIRAHCRSLLISALSSGASQVKVDVARLGADIEEAIFQRFRETQTTKYRSQVTSRQFNIRSNPSLCENLLMGNISADEVAVMSHEDMASEDIKRTREEVRRAGLDSEPSSHQGDCTCRLCLPPWVIQSSR